MWLHILLNLKSELLVLSGRFVTFLPFLHQIMLVCSFLRWHINSFVLVDGATGSSRANLLDRGWNPLILFFSSAACQLTSWEALGRRINHLDTSVEFNSIIQIHIISKHTSFAWPLFGCSACLSLRLVRCNDTGVQITSRISHVGWRSAHTHPRLVELIHHFSFLPFKLGKLLHIHVCFLILLHHALLVTLFNTRCKLLVSL